MSKLEKYLLEKGMPKGWDKETVSKMSKKIGKSPGDEGFFTACVATLGKHMDPETAKGLCANMKDTATGSTFWRGKGKSHDQATKDIKKKQNVKD
jgi:hypothetical protein